jgi:hypothetical protein
MAADENYRLSDLLLPNFDDGNIAQYLRLLAQAIIDRDNEIKSKINQLHIEYVTSAPSDAPDEPEPVLRIYNNAGTIYLYTYINSAWKSVQLS